MHNSKKIAPVQEFHIHNELKHHANPLEPKDIPPNTEINSPIKDLMKFSVDLDLGGTFLISV